MKILFSILFAVSALISFGQEANDSTAHNKVDLSISAGAGLVRNTLTPQLELGLNFNTKKSVQFGLNLQSLYFFERNEDRKFRMFDNYLVGAEVTFGNLMMFLPQNDKRTGFGIAYLFGEKGGYFEKTTMKFYLIRESHARIRPELWMTNNFKTFFPGISIVF